MIVILGRAQHSELLTELLSWVLSRNEFSQVKTSSEKAQKTCSDPNFWKTDISKHFFEIFSWFFAKIRVGTSFRESGRVRKKLEQLVLTLIFKKQTFPKLEKPKSSEKPVFRRALILGSDILMSVFRTYLEFKLKKTYIKILKQNETVFYNGNNLI